MIGAVVRMLGVLVATACYSTLAILASPFDRHGTIFHTLCRPWAGTILRISGVKVHAVGLENLRRESTYVYVSNHASMFDIPAVIAGVHDDIRIVYKKELAYYPFWGWALAAGPYISIDRTKAKDAMKSLDEAAEKMKHGASVLLFPEGTRTRTGKLQPFKRGAFTLAAKSGIPIVPLTINNSYKIMPKGSMRIRPVDIEIVVDPPIVTTGTGSKAGELELMERVRSAIERHYVDQG
jgi:1-acyl-sn-glycerol-3-phosphate acyltransferase